MDYRPYQLPNLTNGKCQCRLTHLQGSSTSSPRTCDSSNDSRSRLFSCRKRNWSSIAEYRVSGGPWQKFVEAKRSHKSQQRRNQERNRIHTSLIPFLQEELPKIVKSVDNCCGWTSSWYMRSDVGHRIRRALEMSRTPSGPTQFQYSTVAHHAYKSIDEIQRFC